MKIKMIRQAVVNGKPEKVGAIVEVTLDDAHLLVGIRKAVPYEEKEPEAFGLDDLEVAPKPRKRGRPKGK